MAGHLEHWGDRVAELSARYGELVVGIDPVLNDAPALFAKTADSRTGWLQSYVDFLLSALTGHVGFVKFQSAFFEAHGSSGLAALAHAMKKARDAGLGIILDAKRGDIGTTASAYARAFLTPADKGGESDLEADCLTINPFLGPDTLEPFVDCARKFGKGLFILAKTSNAGSGWLQDQIIDGDKVSDRIAKLIAGWAHETKGDTGLGCVGAVVGVTYPADAQRLRKLMPESIFLAPGLGAQGGSAQDVAAARRSDGSGVLAAASRGVTKIEDRAIGLDSYGQLIQDRIAQFKAALA